MLSIIDAFETIGIQTKCSAFSISIYVEEIVSRRVCDGVGECCLQSARARRPTMRPSRRAPQARFSARAANSTSLFRMAYSKSSCSRLKSAPKTRAQIFSSPFKPTHRRSPRASSVNFRSASERPIARSLSSRFSRLCLIRFGRLDDASKRRRRFSASSLASSPIRISTSTRLMSVLQPLRIQSSCSSSFKSKRRKKSPRPATRMRPRCRDAPRCFKTFSARSAAASAA